MSKVVLPRIIRVQQDGAVNDLTFSSTAGLCSRGCPWNKEVQTFILLKCCSANRGAVLLSSWILEQTVYSYFTNCNGNNVFVDELKLMRISFCTSQPLLSPHPLLAVPADRTDRRYQRADWDVSIQRAKTDMRFVDAGKLKWFFLSRKCASHTNAICCWCVFFWAFWLVSYATSVFAAKSHSRHNFE